MSKKKNKHNKKKGNKNNHKNNNRVASKTNTKIKDEITTGDINTNANCDANIDANINTVKSKSNIKKTIIIGSLVVLVLGSATFICFNTNKMSDKSYSGIYIEEEHLGKLTKDELTIKLKTLLDEKLEKSELTISHNGKELTATPSELGVSYNIDTIVKDIVNFNKSGNILLDTISRLSLQAINQQFEYAPDINEKVLNKFISKAEKEFYVPAKNSKLNFKGNTLTASTEKNGSEIIVADLKEDILKYINSNFNENKTIKLNSKPVKPILTKEVAEKLEILGTYKTRLPSTTGDRTTNIRIFMDKLNKSVLAPGEEFSANKSAGSRERSDGYRAAPGYVNGEVVPILAGGICQGTSTLYNALLYADMDITERHPHSMPVTYAVNGRDAAIVGDYKDLKFKNNTKNPIVVQTYIDSNGYVVASIWGIPDTPDKKIELSVNHIHSKAADAYKKTYVNGKLVKTELLSRDRYK